MCIIVCTCVCECVCGYVSPRVCACVRYTVGSYTFLMCLSLFKTGSAFAEWITTAGFCDPISQVVSPCAHVHTYPNSELYNNSDNVTNLKES